MRNRERRRERYIDNKFLKILMDLQSLILLDFFVTILEIILDNNYLEVKKKKKRILESFLLNFV